MTSIHNNAGAMVALSTLNTINKNLTEIQQHISTGKTVSSAKDNAAIWAVTTVMEADVDGFSAISESLSLGSATVTVARNAAEKITDLLREVKEKVVTAQGENVDRNKIQTDIDELRNQITSIVAAAQFNGLNLIDGSSTENVQVVSSLDRSGSSVTASDIDVYRQDLSVNANTVGTTAIGGAATLSGATLDATDDGAFTFNIAAATSATGTYQVVFGDLTSIVYNQTNTSADATLTALAFADAINDAGYSGISASSSGSVITVTNTGSFSTFAYQVDATGGSAQVNGASTITGTLAASSELLTLSARTVAEGDSYRVTLTRNVDGTNTATNFDYVARDGEDLNDVATGLKALIEADADFNGVTMFVDSATDPSIEDVLFKFDVSTSTMGIAQAVNSGGTRGGGLGELADLSVLTNTAAVAALDTIEDLIQTSIDAAAAFGSSEKRLEIQAEFVTGLIDSMNLGIGALIDTNMEAASARLQALQVQQQLGVQSLAIANAAPQNILSLFQ